MEKRKSASSLNSVDEEKQDTSCVEIVHMRKTATLLQVLIAYMRETNNISSFDGVHKKNKQYFTFR